ncbi:MAG: right-handed parallel beta-helix repeat-containing protein [Pirellulaceae bacterium]|nr:right-handed parallel beta-helix repeat-containing protein [Pirellulaceae bacterium]
MIKQTIVLFLGLVILSGMQGCQPSDPNLGEPSPGAKVQLEEDGAFHVYPGMDIQAAIEQAADDPDHKTVKVHPGVYAPKRPGQAMVWFHRRHDGVKLVAVGKVVLTAENKKVAIVTSRSYPAIVNHVVYFGNGISPTTILDGFVITGANAHSQKEGVEVVDPQLPDTLQPGLFFFSDGGGVKVFGESSPTLLNLEIIDNEVQVCGGGVSIEQRGLGKTPVTMRNCVLKGNRCPATGSAIDVLEGSAAVIENCLFVGNVGNYGMDEIAKKFSLTYNYEHGCGALTVFPLSTAVVRKCTFTGNWSGVDDRGKGSRYEDCLFWMNNRKEGSRDWKTYELDVLETSTVTNCIIHGEVDDRQNTVDAAQNHFLDSDPEFDEDFVPRSLLHADVGFRPISK